MLFAPLDPALAGPVVVTPEPVADDRGFFARLYCPEEFATQGLAPCAEQWSLSHNIKHGTLRGLHFQAAPDLESKLVRCIAGTLWDVVVDLRPESPTFGRWAGLTLSATNRLALYIPRGFAHGFQTLTDNCDVLYGISPSFRPGQARGVRWDDPDIAIRWPMPPRVISDRDRDLPPLRALQLAEQLSGEPAP